MEWYQKTLQREEKMDLSTEYERGMYTFSVNIPEEHYLKKIELFHVSNRIDEIRLNDKQFKPNDTLDELYLIDKVKISIYTELISPVAKYMASAYYYPPCNCCVEDVEIELSSEDDWLDECQKYKLNRYYTSYKHHIEVPLIIGYFEY